LEISSTKEIKQELQHLEKADLIELCLNLVKAKKFNKELVHVMLFEQNNLHDYIQEIKADTALLFDDVHRTNAFYAKKTLRKIVKHCNNYCQFANEPIVYVDVLLHFCDCFKETVPSLFKNPVTENIYKSQFKKALKYIAMLHEEEQYDYKKQLENLKV
jgi:hypothetical protein